MVSEEPFLNWRIGRFSFDQDPSDWNRVAFYSSNGLNGDWFESPLPARCVENKENGLNVNLKFSKASTEASNEVLLYNYLPYDIYLGRIQFKAFDRISLLGLGLYFNFNQT